MSVTVLADWLAAHDPAREKAKAPETITPSELSNLGANPFAIIPREVAGLLGLSPDLRVLVAIVSHGATSYPGLPRLVELTGLPERNVRRAIARLEKAGALTVQRRRGKVNVYTVRGSTAANSPGLKPPKVRPDRGQQVRAESGRLTNQEQIYKRAGEKQEPTDVGEAAIAALAAKFSWKRRLA
jgi:DNA-binding transcriptional ArsR family regulator